MPSLANEGRAGGGCRLSQSPPPPCSSCPLRVLPAQCHSSPLVSPSSTPSGDAWRETWREAITVADSTNAQPLVERSAHKWAKNAAVSLSGPAGLGVRCSGRPANHLSGASKGTATTAPP